MIATSTVTRFIPPPSILKADLARNVLNIGAVETTLVHNPPLPVDPTWASPPVASDGVIDTNSSLSMSIPENNKLKLFHDVTHLEYFFGSPTTSNDVLKSARPYVTTII